MLGLFLVIMILDKNKKRYWILDKKEFAFGRSHFIRFAGIPSGGQAGFDLPLYNGINRIKSIF
jgi:hypothetical protein